jgi:hypothetical protein
MDPLLISTHYGNFNGTFQSMALLGKETSSLSCLKMIAYETSNDDGPRTLHSGQPSILIDGHQIQLDLNIGPAYQRCCKPSQDEVCLSAHTYKTSGVEWDPKLFDIFDPVRDVVDRDYPFSTFGENCCGKFATFDQNGEHKHRATRIPFESSTVLHHSTIQFGFSPETWYMRLSPLGRETTFNYLIPKDNPSLLYPALWLNENNSNVKRCMASNDPKDCLGKPVLNVFLDYDRHFFSKHRRILVEKKEERKKVTEYRWFNCKLKDIDHAKIHRYKLGRIGLYHKHYKGSTYHFLIE